MWTVLVVCGCSSPAYNCLLAVMRVLINVTHDNELGSHRVGEQKGALEAVAGTIFQVCVCVCVRACVCVNQYRVHVYLLAFLLHSLSSQSYFLKSSSSMF